MKRALHLLLASSLLACSVPRVEGQSEPCDDSSSEVGYTSIEAVNRAMQDELVRIKDGQAPLESYTFNLCPNRVFDATSEPLNPVLNNAFFLCGQNGDPTNDCTISGGKDAQVTIESSEVESYPLLKLTFSGIVFSGFDGYSIAASATFPTTASFMDSMWTNFMGLGVISQPNGMAVELTGRLTTINAASSGVLFENNGGTLRISNLDLTDVDAAAVVSTTNGGRTFLTDSSIRESGLDQITTTSSGGVTSVMNVNVQQMRRMVDAFVTKGSASMTFLQSIVVSNNAAPTTLSRWSVMSVLEGAAGTASNLGVSMNSGMKAVVSAAGTGSRMVVSDSIFARNTGTADMAISASAFALQQAQITLERVELNENEGFTAEVMAFFGSSASISQSCFQRGMAEFVVFIDASSSFEVSMNFVDNYQSTMCPDGSDRLFKEDPGSNCFMPGGACVGTCMLLADQAECQAAMVPTMAPFPGMTALPTPSPTPLQTAPQQPTAAPTLLTASPAPTRKTKEPISQAPTTRNTPTFHPTYLCHPKSKKGKYPKGKGGKGKGGKGKGGKGSKGSSKVKCTHKKAKKEKKGPGKGGQPTSGKGYLYEKRRHIFANEFDQRRLALRSFNERRHNERPKEYDVR